MVKFVKDFEYSNTDPYQPIEREQQRLMSERIRTALVPRRAPLTAHRL